MLDFCIMQDVWFVYRATSAATKGVSQVRDV